FSRSVSKIVRYYCYIKPQSNVHNRIGVQRPLVKNTVFNFTAFSVACKPYKVS
ncbi:protein maelstrom, partial [Biomphalaria glabrata]